MKRFFHKIYAKAFGYFWIPCPLCGKEFGGHEVNYPEAVFVPPNRMEVVCPSLECRKHAAKWQQTK